MGRAYRVAFIPESGIDPEMTVLVDNADHTDAHMALSTYAENAFAEGQWEDGYYSHMVASRKAIAEFGDKGDLCIAMVPYGVLVVI